MALLLGAFTIYSDGDSNPDPGVTSGYDGTAFGNQLRAEERIKNKYGFIRKLMTICIYRTLCINFLKLKIVNYPSYLQNHILYTAETSVCSYNLGLD